MLNLKPQHLDRLNHPDLPKIPELRSIQYTSDQMGDPTIVQGNYNP